MTPAMSELEVEDVTESLANSIVDEIALGLCFEIHRAVRLGLFNWDAKRDVSGDSNVVDAPGVDVFGQPVTKKSIESECPNCSRIMASSRLAPHLEKCLNMGRQSSRVAVQKLAVVNTKTSDSDVDDAEYNPSVIKKGGKKKHKQNGFSPRRNRHKGKPATAVVAARSSAAALDADIALEPRAEAPDRSLYTPTSSGEWSNSGQQADAENKPSVPLEYLQLDSEGRRNLLMQTCAVISETSGKMCSRSHACHGHTEEQRRQVRIFLMSCAAGTPLQGSTSNHSALLPNVENHAVASSSSLDDFHVDVDSYLDSSTPISLNKPSWAGESAMPCAGRNVEPPTKKRKKGRPSAKKSH